MNKTPYDFAGQSEIISPQLVYYPAIIRCNIQKMIKMAGGADRLWPHIKTHKMAEVIALQLEAGITRFKCATIAEAEVAAGAGAAEVVLAYPLVGPNIARFVALTQAFPAVKLYAIGDDAEPVRLLGEAAAAQGLRVPLLVDVDMGQHRTGVALEKLEACYTAWAKLPGIEVCGMHCYDGHRHESSRAVRDAATAAVDGQIEHIRTRLEAAGWPCPVMIYGGTPSLPCHAAMTGGYVSPGTCVVQDAGYRDAYADMDFVPGAAVLTRVVSRPQPDTFTLDMGSKAVACDPGEHRAELVGMEYAETVLQNEEHWLLRVPPEHIQDIPPIGAELFAIPVHVCPTSALYPAVPAVEDGEVAGWWQVAARNRKITY